MKAEWIVWGFWLLAAFLSGSIMFCRFLPRWIAHKDVCVLSADHNPGAGNVFVCCGIPLGMLCLLLDMGKGFLPIYLACRQVNPQHILFALLIFTASAIQMLLPYRAGILDGVNLYFSVAGSVTKTAGSCAVLGAVLCIVRKILK